MLTRNDIDSIRMSYNAWNSETSRLSCIVVCKGDIGYRNTADTVILYASQYKWQYSCSWLAYIP